MSQQQPNPLSLPSINEMFPEYMMGPLYKDRDGDSVQRDSRQGKPSRSPVQPMPNEVAKKQEHYTNSRGRNHDPHHLAYPTTRPIFPVESASRSHSMPENVASCATTQPRVPRVDNRYPSGATHIDTSSFSASNVRSTFRIDVPSDVTTSGLVPSHTISPHERFIEPSNTATHAHPTYPYAPPTSAVNQSVQRMIPTIVSTDQDTDDKKHSCPHCNKRFNRPSSLNIHVNTHTGAKPFQCPFPSCGRSFNVNSNMRRHWRNHLNVSRRRDAVARLMDPMTVAHTPPLSTSPTSSTNSMYSRSLSSPSTVSYASESRSASPDSPYYSDSEDERIRVDSRAHIHMTNPYPAATAGYGQMQVEHSQHRPYVAAPIDRCEAGRARSKSSPMSRLCQDAGYGTSIHGSTRSRSGTCLVPGCRCQEHISTTLRPAFPPNSVPTSCSSGSLR